MTRMVLLDNSFRVSRLGSQPVSRDLNRQIPKLQRYRPVRPMAELLEKVGIGEVLVDDCVIRSRLDSFSNTCPKGVTREVLLTELREFLTSDGFSATVFVVSYEDFLENSEKLTLVVVSSRGNKSQAIRDTAIQQTIERQIKVFTGLGKRPDYLAALDQVKGRVANQGLFELLAENHPAAKLFNGLGIDQVYIDREFTCVELEGTSGKKFPVSIIGKHPKKMKIREALEKKDWIKVADDQLTILSGFPSNKEEFVDLFVAGVTEKYLSDLYIRLTGGEKAGALITKLLEEKTADFEKVAKKIPAARKKLSKILREGRPTREELENAFAVVVFGTDIGIAFFAQQREAYVYYNNPRRESMPVSFSSSARNYDWTRS